MSYNFSRALEIIRFLASRDTFTVKELQRYLQLVNVQSAHYWIDKMELEGLIEETYKGGNGQGDASVYSSLVEFEVIS